MSPRILIWPFMEPIQILGGRVRGRDYVRDRFAEARYANWLLGFLHLVEQGEIFNLEIPRSQSLS